MSTTRLFQTVLEDRTVALLGAPYINANSPKMSPGFFTFIFTSTTSCAITVVVCVEAVGFTIYLFADARFAIHGD